ncbi:MAG: hypothetical protein MMC23_008718 [Stictis urceolatum]|nr:hypothetical protein [Stictis urceolata]
MSSHTPESPLTPAQAQYIVDNFVYNQLLPFVTTSYTPDEITYIINGYPLDDSDNESELPSMTHSPSPTPPDSPPLTPTDSQSILPSCPSQRYFYLDLSILDQFNQDFMTWFTMERLAAAWLETANPAQGWKDVVLLRTGRLTEAGLAMRWDGLEEGEEELEVMELEVLEPMELD